MTGKKARAGKFPAYKQIRQELVNEIELQNPPPNAPYYSERDIIERFMVSRVTVRQALELMEQDGYIYRIQGKGTFIGSLETKPTKTVAFVTTSVLWNGAEMALLRAVEESLNRQNYNLIVCNTNNDFIKTERYLRRLVKTRIDAIIYNCVISDADYDRNAELVEYVLDNEVPCLMLDRTVALPGRRVCAVTADNDRGAYELTKHLLSLGHTRIGFCGAANNSVMQERMAGYLRCLADHGLPVRREYLKKMSSPGDCQVLAMQYLMPEERPTAIIAAHDPMALALMEGFGAFGVKVPEEMAIVGFDDSGSMPSGANGLTSWRVPRDEMGKLAAALLADLLQRKEIAPRQICVPGELIVRESCGAKSPGRVAVAG